MKLSPFSRFIVADRSMLPTYSPGDHILTFNWTTPKAGDVVVFKDKDIFFIKRVESVNSQSIKVSGDNKKESTKFSPTRKDQIIGKVILRY